jgi:hypothetical protein
MMHMLIGAKRPAKQLGRDVAMLPNLPTIDQQHSIAVTVNPCHVRIVRQPMFNRGDGRATWFWVTRWGACLPAPAA